MIKIDIEYVKSVALEAGQRAVAMLDGRQAELKADGSYVTNIDRDTENFVRGRLEERYPDFAFLGEEFGRHGSDTAPLWAVDPIDGTTNLVFGIPQWGVSIGLIHEGESAAGVFFMPRTEETVSGPCGVGGRGVTACRSTRRTEPAFMPKTPWGFTSAAIKKSRYVGFWQGVLRCMGSIAADIAYTARGTFCSLIGMREGAYDMAAAICCAKEAGCIAEYLTGEPLDMDTIVRDGRTVAPFVIAPPAMASLLQSLLKGRLRTEETP